MAVSVLAAAAALTLIPPGGAAARDIAKCVAASKVRSGTRGGVVAAARRQVGAHFRLRAAHHARPGDLNYASLAATCSRGMIRRTWYSDMHPIGMQCSACDSHEYWVRLRRGGWATLGSFSG